MISSETLDINAFSRTLWRLPSVIPIIDNNNTKHRDIVIINTDELPSKTHRLRENNDVFVSDFLLSLDLKGREKHPLLFSRRLIFHSYSLWHTIKKNKRYKQTPRKGSSWGSGEQTMDRINSSQQNHFLYWAMIIKEKEIKITSFVLFSWQRNRSCFCECPVLKSVCVLRRTIKQDHQIDIRHEILWWWQWKLLLFVDEVFVSRKGKQLFLLYFSWAYFSLTILIVIGREGLFLYFPSLFSSRPESLVSLLMRKKSKDQMKNKSSEVSSNSIDPLFLRCLSSLDNNFLSL